MSFLRNALCAAVGLGLTTVVSSQAVAGIWIWDPSPTDASVSAQEGQSADAGLNFDPDGYSRDADPSVNPTAFSALELGPALTAVEDTTYFEFSKPDIGGGDLTGTTTAVPEPSTLWLLGAALVGLCASHRSRNSGECAPPSRSA